MVFGVTVDRVKEGNVPSSFGAGRWVCVRFVPPYRISRHQSRRRRLAAKKCATSQAVSGSPEMLLISRGDHAPWP